jgi:peptidoglycan/xylan/chitin deacetylase (PgdA/CDA1 family)
MLEIAFRLTRSTRVDFSGLDLGIGRTNIASVQQKAECLKHIKQKLKSTTQPAMRQRLESILTRIGVHKDEIVGYAESHEKFRPMGWQQIRNASKRGHCIGSHTITHHPLTLMPLDTAAKEIKGSLDMLRKNIDGIEWVPFAYSYGKTEHVSLQIARLVKDSGYSCALTTLAGINYPGDDLFFLKRVELENGRFI